MSPHNKHNKLILLNPHNKHKKLNQFNLDNRMDTLNVESEVNPLGTLPKREFQRPLQGELVLSNHNRGRRIHRVGQQLARQRKVVTTMLTKTMFRMSRATKKHSQSTYLMVMMMLDKRLRTNNYKDSIEMGLCTLTCLLVRLSYKSGNFY